eukprot:4404316-Prymnesium_polylepis.2
MIAAARAARKRTRPFPIPELMMPSDPAASREPTRASPLARALAQPCAAARDLRPVRQTARRCEDRARQRAAGGLR